MSTFISSITYPSYIKPSQDKNIITHGCCGQILSNYSSFHSFSGIKVDSLHQRVFKFGVFREEASSFELGDVKDKILFGGLERNSKIGSFHQKKFKLRTIREKVSNFDFGEDKDGVLFNGMLNNKNKRVVLVRLNKGFGFNGGGGGGGDNNGRVLGNLALAVGLTYLSFTGQLGWLLDAIVSVWLFVVILPVVGLGVLFWWAGRDIVQSSCPSCGNEFQIFRSAIGEDSQQCPYCSQPFSVEGNEFVSDPINFSREDNTFGQAFNDFFPRSKKGKAVSKTIVDVEAEVTDVD